MRGRESDREEKVKGEQRQTQKEDEIRESKVTTDSGNNYRGKDNSK